MLPAPRVVTVGEELLVAASHNDQSVMFDVTPSAKDYVQYPFKLAKDQKGASHAEVGDATRLRTLNCCSRNRSLWRAARWIAKAASRASVSATAPIIDIGDGPILSHLILKFLRTRGSTVIGGRPFRRLRRQAGLVQKRSKRSSDSLPAVICLERTEAAFHASCRWLRALRQVPRGPSPSELKATRGRAGRSIEVVCSDDPVLPSGVAGALFAEPYFNDLENDWGEAAITLFWSQVTALRGTLASRGVVCPGHASIHGELVSCPALWSQRQPLNRLVEGVDISEMNRLHSFMGVRCVEGQSYRSACMTCSAALLTLDFRTPWHPPWPSSTVRLLPMRPSSAGMSAHALVVWVEWHLARGISWAQKPTQPGAKHGVLLLLERRTVPSEGLLVETSFDGTGFHFKVLHPDV